MKSFLKILILFIAFLVIGFKFISLLIGSLIAVIWFVAWYMSLTNINKDMNEEHLSEKTTTVLIVLGLFLGSIISFYFRIYVFILLSKILT